MAIPFCLSRETSKNDTGRACLLAELRSAKTQPVFHTYVSAMTGTPKAVICTTNERVHLALGRLSEAALRWLVKVFEECTRLDDQMVFTFEPEDGQVLPRNWFITASQNEAQVRVFHVSPGH